MFSCTRPKVSRFHTFFFSVCPPELDSYILLLDLRQYVGVARIGARAPWPIFPSKHSISPHGASEEALAVVKNYLSQCLESHTVCNSNSTGKLPKRLLHVGLSRDERIYLFECGDGFQPYLALSYCWGVSQEFMTTRQTLEDRKCNIDLLSLPQTLQDAVQVAWQMQVPYLWVDSLCIIQDDQIDWAVESGNMGSIYQNALVTISADAAPSVHSGIFCTHTFAGQIDSEIYGPDGESYILCTRNSELFCKPGVTLDDSDTGNRNVHVYALARRAWALQERVLSTRILHYNDREISWECKESFRCECQEPSLSKIRDELASLQMFRPLFQHWDLIEFNKVWQKIVKSYSTRELTHGKDRLPALSGIARLIQELLLRHSLDNTYLAGLWKFNLAQDLAWHKSFWRPNLKKALSYRAPSWSWASIEGRVDFSYGVRSKIQLVNMHYIPASPDPTGEVAEVSLTLRCLCIPIEIRIRPAGHFPARTEKGEATSYHDTERYVIRNQTLVHSEQTRLFQEDKGQLSEANRAYLSLIEEGSGYGDHDFFYDDNSYEPSEFVDKGYKCLLIGESTSGDVRTAAGLQYGKLISNWLMLKPSSRVSGAYERLGFIFSNEVYRCYLRENAQDETLVLV